MAAVVPRFVDPDQPLGSINQFSIEVTSFEGFIQWLVHLLPFLTAAFAAINLVVHIYHMLGICAEVLAVPMDKQRFFLLAAFIPIL